MRLLWLTTNAHGHGAQKRPGIASSGVRRPWIRGYVLDFARSITIDIGRVIKNMPRLRSRGLCLIQRMLKSMEAKRFSPVGGYLTPGDKVILIISARLKTAAAQLAVATVPEPTGYTAGSDKEKGNTRPESVTIPLS